jgi:PAS domain S-box-containing protein
MSTQWEFLVTLNEQLRPLKDPGAIQEVAVRLLAAHLHASRVQYAHIEGDDFSISKACVDGVSPCPARGRITRFGEAIVFACRKGETIVVHDVATDPRFGDAEREQLLADQMAAFVRTPLLKEGAWVATFGVDSGTPRHWTRDDIALIEVTADRTWSAAERARAEDALVQGESRQEFLRRLSDTIRPLADPARVLDETCRLLGLHLRVNRVAYGQIDGDDCVIVSEYLDGLPSHLGRFRWSNLGASRTEDILKGGTLSVSDTSTEPHTVEERAALQAAGIGAYICPLLIKHGRFVGSFGIHSRAPRVWTPDEIALAQDVADRVWATLEHHKAEAELRANQERLAFLLRLNDALRPLGDPAAVLESAARLLAEHLDVTRVGYAELGDGGYVIRHEHTRGVAPLAGRALSGSFGAGLRETYRRGETAVVNDVESDPRFTEEDRAAMKERQMAAFIGVTLIKGGRMVAAFGANNVTARAWTPTEIALVRDVAERTWDAVERARAESALREREHRFRLAVKASGGGSWVWDPRTHEAYWDDAFRERFGFAGDEPPLFETWLARVHAEDRPTMLATLEEVARGRDTWDHTYRFVQPDGTVLWMQSLGRADRDAAGQVTRLTGLELDVTERRRTEAELQARRDEEHDRELRLLLETATQGIVSVDAQGTIVMANRSLEAMFGWDPGELIGQSIERLVRSLIRGPIGHGLHLIGERLDGSTFPVEVSLNHVPTAGGGRAIAFVTDITERQRAESALQERTAELEYRTTQLSQMAWDLTLAEHNAREQIARTLHDGLQQLLFIVSLNLDQQLNRDREAGIQPSDLISEAKYHVDEATAAARSLHLELFPPVLQRSGLPAALTWLANWTREKYKLNVQIEVDSDADSARKDIRTLLFESARELLFNASKHAQAERVTLALRVGADDQLCITVTDDGIGFDPSRLDSRSKSGQVGWGLFSIRDRLALLGGRVDIESAPGQGTRVHVFAPQGVVQSDTGQASDVLAPTIGTAAARNRAYPDALKILIVDDHAAVRSALREMLHEWPQLSVVGGAGNGLEAIARAWTLRPDVILMDVAMPHMDGVEATARIHAALPEIQILGLSMQTRNETVHAIEHAGAAGFFVKGVDTRRLIDHLLMVHASRGAGERASR